MIGFLNAMMILNYLSFIWISDFVNVNSLKKLKALYKVHLITQTMDENLTLQNPTSLLMTVFHFSVIQQVNTEHLPCSR